MRSSATILAQQQSDPAERAPPSQEAEPPHVLGSGPPASPSASVGTTARIGQDPVVLFLGSREDPQIGRIVRALRCHWNCPHAVLDFKTSVFALRTSEAGRFSLTVDGIEIPPTAAVFDRMMFRKGTSFYPAGETCEADFVMEEFAALYRLIAGVFADRVINPLRARSCMVKPHQQTIAAASGLLVPPTLVSNDKAELLGFVGAATGHLIMKPLGQPTLHAAPGEGDARLIMTNRVDVELLRGEPQEAIATSPSFLQHEVPKNYEMRVVCIGSTLLSFRIDSQRRPGSSTDWRRLSTQLSYERCDLAEETSASILRFMRSIGLLAGHLDLIVDPEDRVWFLECNGQGAWGWLDELVDGQIALTYAQRLVQIATAPLDRVDEGSLP